MVPAKKTRIEVNTVMKRLKKGKAEAEGGICDRPKVGRLLAEVRQIGAGWRRQYNGKNKQTNKQNYHQTWIQVRRNWGKEKLAPRSLQSTSLISKSSGS
jgi:hypothetical protein